MGQMMSQGMSYAKAHGLHKVVEITPSAVAALSIQEAAELTGKDDFRIVVRSLEDALPIVDGLVQQLHSVRPASLLALATANE